MIVIYRVGKQIAGAGGRLGSWRCVVLFHYDGDVKSIAGAVLETGLAAMGPARRVHWTVELYSKRSSLTYVGIIAPGFECHVSQSSPNNTPPFVGFSIYLFIQNLFSAIITINVLF